MDMLTREEKAQAELSWKFDESAEVVELRAQLTAGLISVVEFSNKILASWDQFQLEN